MNPAYPAGNQLGVPDQQQRMGSGRISGRVSGRGSPSAFPDGGDVKSGLRNRFSNIVGGKSQIEKEREAELDRRRIEEEFAEIDKNGDGFVTPDELVDFLDSRVGSSNKKSKEFDRNIC